MSNEQQAGGKKGSVRAAIVKAFADSVWNHWLEDHDHEHFHACLGNQIMHFINEASDTDANPVKREFSKALAMLLTDSDVRARNEVGDGASHTSFFSAFRRHLMENLRIFTRLYSATSKEDFEAAQAEFERSSDSFAAHGRVH